MSYYMKPVGVILLSNTSSLITFNVFFCDVHCAAVLVNKNIINIRSASTSLIFKVMINKHLRCVLLIFQ